jgi:Patatin-like phospholipase
MAFGDAHGAPGTRRLLALDGGGIRGMITLEILAEIENQLRQRLGRGSDFVLADYFDYVAGTSTGAIIAACISLGMSVASILEFYEANGRAMFEKSSLLKRLRYKYEDDRLADKLREVIRARAGTPAGAPEPTLGSDALRTGLMMVMRNATTDSPWLLSNNPGAKYNARSREDCNLDLPLWQLIRASTAAPVYFPPEVVQIGRREFVFVDGGLTPYNNPAFILFLMSTLEPYRVGWPAGEDRMLLVSVGTGTNPAANENLDPSEMNLLYNAGSLPSALMYAALNEQDMLCRAFGRCRAGAPLDREIGTLMDGTGPLAGLGGDLSEKRLFTYMRYNCELSRAGLDALGLQHVEPRNVQRLDSIEYIPQLREVGRTAAKDMVRASHFDGFV